MRVTIQHFDGCPHWQLVDRRLRSLADELDLTIAHQRIDTPEDAERHGFRGSPTVLVEGTDPFGAPDAPTGLSCRVYDTPDGPAGAPTVDQLRDVLAPPGSRGELS